MTKPPRAISFNIDLGTAGNFIEFDQDNLQFNLYADRITGEYAGDHDIQIEYLLVDGEKVKYK